MRMYAFEELELVESNPGDGMPQFVNDCMDCKQTCLETVAYCCQIGGVLADASTLKPILDCAMICEPSAYFVARGSDLLSELCSMCAQLCQRCAVESQKFTEDPQIMKCVEMCRRCGESCEHVIEMTSRVLS